MSDHGCLIFQVDVRQKPDELIQSVKRMFCIYSIFRTRAVLNELIRGHSSAGRAPALQAGGRGFDSRCLHQAGTIPAPEENKVRL